MMKVKVDQMILHAFHGVFAGEPLVGGDFEINLSVEYDDSTLGFESLTDTISYVDLIELIRSRMQVPTPLLEKLAKLILDDVLTAFPFIKSSTISIVKLQPPIPRFQGRVGVSLSRMY